MNSLWVTFTKTELISFHTVKGFEVFLFNANNSV